MMQWQVGPSRDERNMREQLHSEKKKFFIFFLYFVAIVVFDLQINLILKGNGTEHSGIKIVNFQIIILNNISKPKNFRTQLKLWSARDYSIMGLVDFG